MPADALTASIVDIPSPSGGETRLADEVESTLRRQAHLTVERDGDAVMARTDVGAGQRVVIAGHLDTVPVADNLPSRREGDRLYGCGTSDMKSGLAVMLRLAVTVAEPRHDVTWLFYDNEETDAAHNGLGRVLRNAPQWLTGRPRRADGADRQPGRGRLPGHAARPRRGYRQARALGAIVAGQQCDSRRRGGADPVVGIPGASGHDRRLRIPRGLNAVRIEGGVSGNVVPDRCTIAVNHRFAPDRTEAEALAHVQELLAPFECVLTDSAPAAPPRLNEPAAADFLAAIGGAPQAKLGWTDVARFASLGIPAVNFGPGDPNLAHTREEYVELPRIGECERMLRTYLTG